MRVTLTEGTSMAAAAAPDRKWIAIDLLGALWVLPYRGGDAKRITPDFLEARQPSWSPDNESIAFQGYGDDGARHIYTISREGGDTRALTSGEFDDREPASAAGEDVFPFRPQWTSASELLYTADGHIKRKSLTGAATVVPFNASVAVKRDTYAIAPHQALEPADPQPLTGIVMDPTGQPGPKGPGLHLSHPSPSRRRDRTLQIAYASRGRLCRAISPVQNSPPTTSQCAGSVPGTSGSLCSTA